MLHRDEIERLRSIDTDKVVSAITRSTFSANSSSVFAAAYVLMRAIEDYRISIDSLELYIKTAEEPLERELFIRQALENCWNEIRELKFKFSADEFKAVVLFESFSQYKTEFYATPAGISQLASELLRLKAGDKVLDICTGTGSFIRECCEMYPEASFIGVDINSDQTVIAAIRAELIGGDIQIQRTNVFDAPSLERSFDAVFANYPFVQARGLGSIADEYVRTLSERSPAFARLSSMDWVFNKKAYECIDGPGRVICIMSNGSTWNTTDRNARRFFLERGLVEAVIALPARLFDSFSIPTTMIVFSFGNTSTMMVDASECCEIGRRNNVLTAENIKQILSACFDESSMSRRVTYDEIAGNNFNLSPANYVSDTESITIENGVELGLIAKIKRGAQIQAAELDRMSSRKATDYQYLMLANIQEGMIQDELPYLRELDQKLEKYCLKDNDLILSKNGAPYKIAVAEVKNGQKILANGNLYILTVDEKVVDPYYIKAFFESKVGTASLKKITVGSTIPNIGIEQLSHVLIPLPSLDEQKKITDEYKACIAEVKLLKRKMAKTIDRMSHLFDDREEG